MPNGQIDYSKKSSRCLRLKVRELEENRGWQAVRQVRCIERILKKRKEQALVKEIEKGHRISKEAERATPAYKEKQEEKGKRAAGHIGHGPLMGYSGGVALRTILRGRR